MILPVEKKSNSLKKAVQMTGHKIEIYCNSRWFRHTANRNLLNAWHDFQETLSVAVPQRPKRGYGYETVSKSSDSGLDRKLEGVLEGSAWIHLPVSHHQLLAVWDCKKNGWQAGVTFI